MKVNFRIFTMVLAIGILFSGCQNSDNTLKKVSTTSETFVSIKETRSTMDITTSKTTSKYLYENVNAPLNKTKNKAGFQLELPKQGDEIAILHIKNFGEIRIRLFPEETPKAVENFKGLINKGYYNGLDFFMVAKDLMMQCGEKSGNPAGGTSYFNKNFSSEFTYNLLNIRGSVAMWNEEDNQNNTVFIINQRYSNIGGTVKPMILSQYSDNYIQWFLQTEKKYFEEYESTYGKETNDMFRVYMKQQEQNETLMIPSRIPDEVYSLYDQYGGSIYYDGAFTYKGGFPVFGQIFSDDMKIVDEIANTPVNRDNKPDSPVVIEKAEIVKYKG